MFRILSRSHSRRSLHISSSYSGFTASRLVSCTKISPLHPQTILFSTTFKMSRVEPNIIITGTPGVGKTTHCRDLAAQTGLHHLDVNDVVKKHNIGETSDDPDDPHVQIVDEDRLLDIIENDLADGGQIIDWHACDLFPESYIDLVVVLRCNNTLLYDRLKARKYGEKKLQENLDCEIMETLLDEAREAYKPEIVQELRSETTQDVDENVARLVEWVKNWKENNAPDGASVTKTKEEQDRENENNPLFLHG